MNGFIEKGKNVIRGFFYLIYRVICKKNRKFATDKRYIADCRFFGEKGRHVFFGYYDLPQISADGSKMLVLTAGKDADPARDKADAGYFDLPGGEYHSLAATSAWCRQQGARLRWHPLMPETVLFNDADDGKYVTKAIDQSGQNLRVIAPALYDISSDFKYGVSVNFARLQRLRPGYGYSSVPDMTADNPAPEDDGVFLVNLQSGKIELVVSLRELSGGAGGSPEAVHYINHVSFSPDGRKFMFFHIAVAADTKLSSGRIIKLYVYNTDTGDLKLIESDRITSHYCWRSPDELLTTSDKDGKCAYFLYDLAAGKKTLLDHNLLKTDGHPSYFDNKSGFVYDTYPDKLRYQKLYMYDSGHDEAAFLAEFYHRPVKYNDMRCDLHPRLWEKDGRKVITLDTTCGGERRVALLELNI